MRRSLGALVWLMGCGDGAAVHDAAPSDGATDAAIDAAFDAMLDAAPDAPPPALRFVPASLPFGSVEAGTTTTATVMLHNDSATPAPIDAIRVGGAVLARESTTCAATLAAGDSCGLTLRVTAPTLGTVAGVVEVTSGGTSYAAPASGTGLHRLTIKKNSGGTVTSAPAGIDCNANCTALFTGDVVLTATPSPNQVFVGWSVPGCGSALTCTVPAEIPHQYVFASFAATATASVAITFAGDAVGEVEVLRITPALTSGLVGTCYASCAVPVEPGDVIELETNNPQLASRTVSANCVPVAGSRCRITVAAGTNPTTVTFTRGPKVAWTRLYTEQLFRTAHDSDGNLYVVTPTAPTTVQKLAAATGQTLWIRPMPGLATLEAGLAGTMYAAFGSELVKLDPDGDELWRVAVPAEVGTVGCTTSFSKCLAVAPDGSVAARGASGFGRWTAAGALAWAKTLTFGSPGGGIGIETSGVVVVPRVVDLTSYALEGYRFAAADGAQLANAAGYLGLIGQESVVGNIDIDGSDRIASAYSGHSKVCRQVGANPVACSAVSNQSVPVGVRASASGEIGAASSAPNNQSWAVSRSDAVGTSLAGMGGMVTTNGFGTLAVDFSLSESGRLGAVGTYKPFCPDTPLTCLVLGWVGATSP